jgi:serine protease Do
MTGDVIISWDGWPIESANDFRNRVATTKPGKKVEIGLWRQGKKMIVQAEVSAYKPSSLKVAAAETEVRKKLGMEVKEISIMEARRKRLDKREGVLVTKVDPQGPAGRAGIEPGDIIYQMKNQPIRGLSDYLRLLAQIQPGEEVLLLLRDGRTGDIGYLTVVAE